MPQEIVKNVPIADVSRAGASVTALRLEGFAPSIAHHRSVLERLLSPLGELHVLNADVSTALWQAVREVMPFVADTKALWPRRAATRRSSALLPLSAPE